MTKREKSIKFCVEYKGFLSVVCREFDTHEERAMWIKQVGQSKNPSLKTWETAFKPN